MSSNSVSTWVEGFMDRGRTPNWVAQLLERIFLLSYLKFQAVTVTYKGIPF